ncbi:MAG TPA: hypothetical protein VME19_08965 [Streptosporangiaceae bacterium]|nr:hypothetical protein [Streptosporangiaceae bacterium]
MARSGTPETSAAPPGGTPGTARVAARHARPTGAPSREHAIARRLLVPAAMTLTAVLLFVAYLMVSRTYPENSDEANILLMASDMLHGNVLLHGWYLSDVSFYTTELPQYAMLERLIGLHAGTAHVAAAMTYTLVVLVAALLARGATAQPGAWPRVLLTTAIMFAPQLGVAVFVLLLSVGHIGTAVPLMLIWLVIDFGARDEAARLRWWVPVLVGVLLAWVLVADPLVLVIGIVPLVGVCAIRVIGAVIAARRHDRGSPGWLGAILRARRYEVYLAAAAILAYGAASLVNRLLRASGGFILHPVGYTLAPLHTWLGHARVTGQGLLALFGARPQGPAVEMTFAIVHLAGVALVAWAICRVARHFFSWPDLVSQVLLVAMVVNVLVYIPSTLADATDLNAREFAVVLPFGAVLAGRTLAARLLGGEVGRPAWVRGATWRIGVASALLAGYAASLGYAAAQPSAPPANAQLASFLAEHHLTEGVGGYWLSSIVTVDSDGAVTVRALLPGGLQPDLWESKPSWYDPASYHPTFLVTDSQSGFFNHWEPNPAALAAYGRPARTYRAGPYTVFVWDKNLLAGHGS